MRFIPTRRTLLQIKNLCTHKRIRQTAFCLITSAIAATVVIALKTIKDPASIIGSGLIILAVSPYVYLAMILTLVSRSRSSIAIAVSVFLVSGFGMLLFLEGLVIHPDAHGKTIFMVASVWQWAFLLLVTLPVYLLNRPKKTNPLIEGHKN